MSATQKPLKAYARPSRNHSEAWQRKQLIAAGYPADKFYVEGRVGMAELLRSIRDKPCRIGVTSLGRLAATRDLLRDVLIEIIDARSVVHDVETNIQIATKREAMIAAAAFDASRELVGDARGMSKAEAARRGKLGGEANAASVAERLSEERLPITPARKIWRDKKSRMTNKERLRQMPGWSQNQAYDLLGKRGAAHGRPRKDET